MGEAYPGSTGGEIFNYYGTGVNANTASGNYSTTIGYNNKNTGEQSFVGGNSNTNASNRSLVYGYNNTLTIADGAVENFILGGTNSNTPKGTTPQKGTIIIGNDNVMNQSGRGNKMFGTGLKDDTSSYQRVYLGTFNAPATTAPHYTKFGGFTLGAGKNDTTRYNAMEIFTGAFAGGNNEVHIPSPFYFSLNTLGNKANEIVAPLDPSNPTTADQTLATKAYIDSLFSQVKRTQVLIDGQSTVITPGADLPLETTFNITIPSWSTNLVLGLNRVVSGVDFFTYLTIDLSTSRRYSGCLGETNDILYYNTSTKGVETLINDLSIVSIRAEN